MTFPYYFHILGHPIHPHLVLELAAYLVGFSVHMLLRARQKALGTPQAVERNLWLIVGAVFGALAGAKILNAFEAPADSAPQLFNLSAPISIALGGKTIVGGLVGAWIGIEIAKKFTHITARTGDSWVLPLTLAIAIGRIGCFLTGLDDHTHGIPSSLPWATDFGDHIPRHPTQLYESLFVLLLGSTLLLLRPHLQKKSTYQPGTLFRLFMLGYCSFRFVIEFIKPTHKPLLGLSPIQLVCTAVCLYCLYDLTRKPKPSLPRPESPSTAVGPPS